MAAARAKGGADYDVSAAAGYGGGRESTFGSSNPMAASRARDSESYNVPADRGYEGRESTFAASNPMPGSGTARPKKPANGDDDDFGGYDVFPRSDSNFKGQ